MLLSLVLHNHQPVGNFPGVFETAYTQSYLPMLRALERHPPIRAGLHYSGPVLDWLEAAHPEFFDLVQRLIDRGQVELLTGGYYEPILTSIPDRDKQGQILKMTGYLQRRFGARPRGLWLAERVWEPHLPRALEQAGVGYTIVDDTHFLAAGRREEQLTGYFVTEEQGSALAVFASLRALRYLIPWQPVGEVIAYLRGRAGTGETLLMMGDDGEKFGLWPGTYAHCWEQGWIEAFFAALETEASWVRTVTPSEAFDRPAAGRVYLPAASYEEMMEWAGGFWRNFLVKYPEINTMHKRMLRVSAKVWDMPAGPQRDQALDELWKGQGNCPYWHGVFGGIYLPHLRQATFSHLIAAEALADAAQRDVRVTVDDLDADGADEVEVSSPEMVLVVDPAEGGSAVEWHWREAQLNLVNVLTRRPEAYHEQLRSTPAEERTASDGIETIHTTRVRVKEPGLERLLRYDRYRKASFLEHFLPHELGPDEFQSGEHTPQGQPATRPYAAARDGNLTLRYAGPVTVSGRAHRIILEKTFILVREARDLTVRYRLTNAGEERLESVFAMETNWAVFDPASPAVRTMGDAISDRVTLSDTGWPGAIVMEMPGARIWRLPLETVSNSEAGYERILQGLTCVARWPIALEPAQSWETRIVVSLPDVGEGRI